MRNDKQIRKLKACISALEAKRKAALEAAGSIEDDDEWDAESMRIHTELSPLTLAIECGSCPARPRGFGSTAEKSASSCMLPW